MDEKIYLIVEKYLHEKGLSHDIAATFEDVLIIDQKSDIPSRSSIKDTRSRLARDFFLNIPVVSANMDTVTESQMAIALARLGGIGFIHQFLPIEKRVREIEKVKRADSGIIERPFTVGPDLNLRAAREMMKKWQVSGLLVVDSDTQKLVGILTSRDVRFEDAEDKKVAVFSGSDA